MNLGFCPLFSKQLVTNLTTISFQRLVSGKKFELMILYSTKSILKFLNSIPFLLFNDFHVTVERELYLFHFASELANLQFISQEKLLHVHSHDCYNQIHKSPGKRRAVGSDPTEGTN
jgi:hypothetical protein